MLDVIPRTGKVVRALVEVKMNTSPQIRVMVVDDHPLFLEGLAAFFEAADDLLLVGQCSDGRLALALCAEVKPDVILMDLNLPGLDGASAIEAIHTQFPTVPIIALTGMLDEQRVRRALQAGATGFLLKTLTTDELSAAIRQAAAGKTVLASEAARILMRIATHPAEASAKTLTAREADVLTLMVAGATNVEIAEKLALGRETIKSHVHNILNKLGASGRVEAVAIAVRRGLVSGPSPK